ncbi:hypothetical protein [Yinghuangia soli]|uniref:Uncharacterized protein n=1 Tax=Yinghuangia soli TaxID=2908204 RepID=A0AA41PTX6_9ACTN|nr:hypothetical protein [Yinghuangia soli]MCF2525663.1 hypothetical protein [Yinghuangia soli]
MAFDPGMHAAQHATADAHRRTAEGVRADAGEDRGPGRRTRRRRWVGVVSGLVQLGAVVAALVWAGDHPDTVQQWVDGTWAFIDAHH